MLPKGAHLKPHRPGRAEELAFAAAKVGGRTRFCGCKGTTFPETAKTFIKFFTTTHPFFTLYIIYIITREGEKAEKLLFFYSYYRGNVITGLWQVYFKPLIGLASFDCSVA